MTTVGVCDDCGCELPAHECRPVLLSLRKQSAAMDRAYERGVDLYLDDDRGYPTEDDNRVPPPEEGEPG